MPKQNWKPGTVLYPVPVVMVSCGSMDGEKNIITVAWTGTINSDPAMTYISLRPSRHSYDIIKQSKEFVINLVTKKLTYACDYCGVKSGKEIDKFKEMHLTVQKFLRRLFMKALLILNVMSRILYHLAHMICF